MSMLGISSTQSQPASGLLAAHQSYYKKRPDPSPTPASTGSTDASAQGAEPLASAIAAALTQLGLTSTTSVANFESTDASSPASSGSLPLQPRVSQQIQQYKNMASTFSGLAQALSASSSSKSPDPNSSGSLTTVLQSLWTSLDSSSGASADSSNSAIPSLPTFMKTLARQLSESGITGLRGVFVDTVA